MGDFGRFGGGRGGGRGGGGRGGGRGGGGRGGGGGGGFRSGPGGPKDQPDYYREPNAENFCKLFLGGLAPETTEDSIREHFGSYGNIVDCVVMRDAEKKRSRGFGFVTFDQSSCVTDVQANRPHKIDGKQVETKRATPKSQQAEGTDAKTSTDKLFVGGVKDEMSESMFREEFSKYGNIKDVKIVQGRGFAFITFDDNDPVDWCSLIGRFQIGDKWVNAKKAQDKKKEGGFGQQGGYGGGGGGYGGGGYSSGGGGGYGDSYGGGNDYGGDFGQNYQSSYGGGPMKQSSYGNQRSQPYGGGGESDNGGYSQGGYGSGGGGGYDSYSSGGGGYSSGGGGYGSGGGGGGYGSGGGGYGGGGGGGYGGRR